MFSYFVGRTWTLCCLITKVFLWSWELFHIIRLNMRQSLNRNRTVMICNAFSCNSPFACLVYYAVPRAWKLCGGTSYTYEESGLKTFLQYIWVSTFGKLRADICISRTSSPMFFYFCECQFLSKSLTECREVVTETIFFLK